MVPYLDGAVAGDEDDEGSDGGRQNDEDQVVAPEGAHDALTAGENGPRGEGQNDEDQVVAPDGAHDALTARHGTE